MSIIDHHHGEHSEHSGHFHHHQIHKSSEKISRLKIALLITALGMLIEFVGGILSNSLALVSDAWHMLTHLFALGTSFFAILLSLRPATKKKTYGFYRAEVIAAFCNGIVLIFISGYIVYEAIQRFISPQPIRIVEMLFVAGIGLVINGVSTYLLASVSAHDINIKSAFLHEIGDMISSIAVVVAALVIYYTNNYIFDPILAFLISILIVIWSWKLVSDSVNILLEATPKHLDIDVVVATIKNEIPGIYDVNHVHAWTISSNLYAMTANIIIEDCQVSKANEVQHKINHILRDRFRIGHTNLQFECFLKKT